MVKNQLEGSLMNLRRSFSVGAGALLACALVGAAPASVLAATTWDYPSALCPLGDTGLQDCIDGTAAGDTVRITQDDLADQGAFIGHSLTLTAASGHHPTLYSAYVNDGGASGSLNVTVEGLTFVSYTQVFLSVGTDHTVTFRNIGVTQAANANFAAMSLETSVPSTISVIGSRLQYTGEYGGISVSTTNATGLATIQAIGNRISASGATSSGAGVAVQTTGNGAARVEIMNNAIWDVGTCGCGQDSAIAIDGGSLFQTLANVVGNTVDRARATGFNIPALSIKTESDAGVMTVNAFNNVFTRSGVAFAFSDGIVRALFAAGYNDSYKNTSADELNGHSLGSHNLTSDPKFANEAARNLRLVASSPVIDAGLVCSSGGVANLDAAGHGRLHGATVDMGAYERGAAAPTGVARVGTSSGESLVGTSGDDILCGYGGPDFLDGKGGNDYLRGGPGADVIVGGHGSDRLFGDGGADTLCARDGTHGNDHLDGGAGPDGYLADPGDVKVGVEHSATCT
jgi:RTX calcium-binding nonapeptide repeat (4 copies)